MDLPWITFAPADKSREYLALLSYLPLNRYGAIPGFLRFLFQIQRQLRGTPGIVGYSLRAKLIGRNFWTLSAWNNETALMDFVAKVPHGQAMKALLPHMGRTRFTQWKVSGAELPLRWDDAIQRSQEASQQGEPS